MWTRRHEHEHEHNSWGISAITSTPSAGIGVPMEVGIANFYILMFVCMSYVSGN